MRFTSRSILHSGFLAILAFKTDAFSGSNQLQLSSTFTRPLINRNNRASFSIYSTPSEQTTEANSESPFSTAFSSLLTTFSTTTSNKKKETEEERQLRLQLERRAILEEGEIKRQSQVKEDALPYLFLFSLQLLPLLGSERIYSLTYFLGLAICTVYVGGRQKTLEPAERVTKENALYAPIGASISIAFLYALLKFGIDPTTLYAIGVTIFGALAISDVGVPILRNVLPSSFAETELDVPESLAKKLNLNPPTVPLDGVVTLVLGILASVYYWSPIAMTQKFIVSNSKYGTAFKVSFFFLPVY